MGNWVRVGEGEGRGGGERWGEGNTLVAGEDVGDWEDIWGVVSDGFLKGSSDGDGRRTGGISLHHGYGG